MSACRFTLQGLSADARPLGRRGEAPAGMDGVCRRPARSHRSTPIPFQCLAAAAGLTASRAPKGRISALRDRYDHAVPGGVAASGEFLATPCRTGPWMGASIRGWASFRGIYGSWRCRGDRPAGSCSCQADGRSSPLRRARSPMCVSQRRARRHPASTAPGQLQILTIPQRLAPWAGVGLARAVQRRPRPDPMDQQAGPPGVEGAVARHGWQGTPWPSTNCTSGKPTMSC